MSEIKSPFYTWSLDMQATILTRTDREGLEELMASCDHVRSDPATSPGIAAAYYTVMSAAKKRLSEL